MAKGLTEKQRSILEFIIDFQKDKGFPPTIRETGDHFAIGSLRGVTVHLDALVRKEYITRSRASRSVRVIGSDPRTLAAAKPAQANEEIAGSVRLPLVRSIKIATPTSGYVSDPIIGEEQVERYVLVPHDLAAPATPQGFVIRIGASGVRNEAILSGDLIVVRPQTSVPEGELLVLFEKGDFILCRSEGNTQNASGGEPLRGKAAAVGRVVGLMRRY